MPEAAVLAAGALAAVRATVHGRTAEQMGDDRTESLGITLRQAWLLARNDIRQEVRELELVMTAGFFTLVVLVMFGLSFSALSRSAQVLAIPGMLWLSVAFIGALTLTRIFDRERESDTLRALLVAPVDRLAIYLSKAAVTLVVLLGCAAIVVPGLVFLFPAAAPLAERPGATVGLVVAGSVAYAAIGTLFAAGLATSSGKNVLLSVILYPLTMPTLLWALVTTRVLLEGHEAFATYLGQLAAVDVVVVVVAAWVFEPVLVGVGRRGGRRRRR
jgi:heme exporter protein B